MFLLVIHVVLLPTQHLCFDTQKFYWAYASSPVHILYGRRMQHMWAFDVRSQMHYPFSKPFENLSMLIDSLALRYKLCMIDTLSIRKVNQRVFDFDLFIPAFFGFGEVGVCHNMLAWFPGHTQRPMFHH